MGQTYWTYVLPLTVIFPPRGVSRLAGQVTFPFLTVKAAGGIFRREAQSLSRFPEKRDGLLFFVMIYLLLSAETLLARGLADEAVAEFRRDEPFLLGRGCQWRLSV
jgi:hypothetical protein